MNSLTTTISLSEQDRELLKGAIELTQRLENLRKGWLNEQQAADHVGRSISTVKRWRREGLIPYCQDGEMVFFKTEDIDAFLESRRVVTIQQALFNSKQRAA